MQTLNSNNIKCRNHLSYVLATGFVLAAISTATFAADRVVEDSLVYKDPTVAHQNQIVEGISLDYYSLAQSFTIPTTYVNLTGTQTYQQPGISGFVGSGDFTVLASYRSGTGTVNASGANTSGGIAVTANANDAYTQSEYELDLRWLMTNYQTTYFTPYALVGYVGQTRSETITATVTATNRSSSVSATNTSTSSVDSSSSTPLIGVGGIIPINQKIGFRIDAKFGFVTATSGGVSTSYNASRLTATMYYNFADAWNAQLGARTESYSNGDQSTTGGYAMLGYTFK